MKSSLTITGMRARPVLLPMRRPPQSASGAIRQSRRALIRSRPLDEVIAADCRDAALLWIAALTAPATAQQPAVPEGPIAFIGHGAMFDFPADADLATLHARVDELWRDRIVEFERNLRMGRSAPRDQNLRIVPFDPEWPARADRLIARIRHGLGDHLEGVLERLGVALHDVEDVHSRAGA